ncbi:VOC family protein [Cryptosporangium phraense]|uniref:VOC domain-containing protein n=1 Tax=Cryptosporangium phraense TaxID=2593070 RepID=A0A545AQ29_9ACTN|nr:VOC family protein [Cryptosporangium phraense]TQS43404.1 hypothetical protein FL583_19425 [Cryptosporangium phraense]
MTIHRDLHHVGITVRDLDESLAWYEHVFGLRPAFVYFTDPNGVTLELFQENRHG